MIVVIDDAIAFVRYPKGVFRQAKLYSRGERIYVQHGTGYVRLCAKFGNEFLTSHPDIKVIEIDAPMIDVTREPKLKP